MAAPPLLLLTDIRHGFGSTRLLDGAGLSVAPGERLALVGRNGSGKSTLLKVAAGIIEAEGGTRFVQPGATMRYLEQEPDLSAFPDVMAYVQAGLGPADDPHRARYLLEQLGMTGAEAPAALSGGETRRAALALGLSGDSAAMIASVEAGSPADKAGLREGDILLYIDGRPVTGADDVVRLMVGARIGLPVEVSYIRRGKLEKASVTPIERERR